MCNGCLISAYEAQKQRCLSVGVNPRVPLCRKISEEDILQDVLREASDEGDERFLSVDFVFKGLAFGSKLVENRLHLVSVSSRTNLSRGSTMNEQISSISSSDGT